MNKTTQLGNCIFLLILTVLVAVVAVSCGEEPRNDNTTPVKKPDTPIINGGGDEPVTGGDEPTATEWPKKVSEMTTEEKVGQMLLARCIDDFGSLTLKHAAGIVMFAVDFKGLTKEQIQNKIEQFQKSSKYPLMMCVDEEGGTVVRVSSNTNIRKSKFLSPREYYAEGGIDKLVETEAEKAAMLKELGLNMNLAPVADIALNSADFMYKRSLGLPAKDAIPCIKAMVNTAHEGGMSTCLKHFPGYGNNADTHTGIALDERPYATFETSDFLPFIAGIEVGTDAILVSHNIMKCIDDKQPASISPEVHKVLRETLGYKGLIMTDDMSMGAMSEYGLPYIKAVLAGNDLIIVTDFQMAYSEIMAGITSKLISMDLVDAAVERVLAWKIKHFATDQTQGQ